MSTQTGVPNQAEVASVLMNGLFNSDLFRQLMGSPAATPFENLLKQVQSQGSKGWFNEKEDETDTYVPKWNKYNKNNSISSNEITFKHTPYLYTDNDDDSDYIMSRLR